MSNFVRFALFLYINAIISITYADIVFVDKQAPDCDDNIGQPFCRINAAIAKVPKKSTIHIANGVYVENLKIKRDLILIGENSTLTVIDGARLDSVININAGVHGQIKSLLLRNGFADNGGGILNYGAIMLDDVNIDHNWARFNGGGIYNASSISGSLYVKNSYLSSNHSLGDDKQNIRYGGGAIYNNAPFIMENSTLEFNQAVDNGGGIYSVFSGRKKFSEGELFAEKLGINSTKKRVRSLRRKKDVGSVSILKSRIRKNYADAGGGINVHGVLNISSSIIEENRATNGFRSSGGGIFAHFDTTLNLNNVLINHNIATFRGGGVRFYTVGKGNFSSISIIDNQVLKSFGQGAGIFIIRGETKLKIKNSLIARNMANLTRLDDCYGAFESLGYNYFSNVTHCTGYQESIDKFQPLTGVDYLYQWNNKKSRYTALPNSPLVDNANPEGCSNQNGDLLSADVYGHSREGVKCDIGAIESL